MTTTRSAADVRAELTALAAVLDEQLTALRVGLEQRQMLYRELASVGCAVPASARPEGALAAMGAAGLTPLVALPHLSARQHATFRDQDGGDR